MSDQPDTLMLAYLRRLDEKMDRLDAKMDDLQRRLTTLEIQVGRQSATGASQYGNTMLRLDQIEKRIGRIERRLDLAEAPVS